MTRSMNLTTPRTSLVNAERKRHQTRRAYKQRIEEAFEMDAIPSYDTVSMGAEPADDAFQLLLGDDLEASPAFISLSMNPKVLDPSKRRLAAIEAALLVHLVGVLVKHNEKPTGPKWDEPHLSHLCMRINPNSFRQNCVTAEFHGDDVYINYTPIYDSEECIHLRMPALYLPVLDGVIVLFFQNYATLGNYAAFDD